MKGNLMGSDIFLFIVSFAAIYIFGGFIFKSYLLSKAKVRVEDVYSYLFVSPFYSTNTWNRIRNSYEGDTNRVFRKSVFHGILITLLYTGYKNLNYHINDCYVYKILFLGLTFYIVTEFIGSFIQLVFLLRGKYIPDLHNYPLKSKNITQFWSNGWNVWVKDWLFEFTPVSLRRHSSINIVYPFIISGIWHEFLINIPVYLITEISNLGTMIIFFSIQGAGVLIDKKILRIRSSSKSSILRYMFFILLITLSLPLFFNQSLLELFY